MFSSLEFKLENLNKNIMYQSSSLFQGVIMENISEEVATDLHHLHYNPYSQFVKNDEDTIWRINGLNEMAYKKIIQPLMGLDKIYLKNKSMDISLENMKLETVKREHFIEKYLFGEGKRTIEFSFITPTAFKSQGRYIIMPDTRFIFQNLMKKFDATGKEELFSYDLLEQLAESSYISRYRLRSVLFSIEKTKIPSFLGDIQIKVESTKEMRNIANLLVEFGAYSGIGIKTGMGMGAIRMRGEDIG